MARLRGHKTLDFDKPLVCRRAMTTGGRSFDAGAVFPWRDLGLALRKVHQLWEQRRIAHGHASERSGAEPVGELVRLPAAVVKTPIVGHPKTPHQSRR